MKKNIIFFLFNLVLFLNFASCDTTEPPVDGNALALKLEDVSCTEAWITLTTNLTLPTTVTLKQNNQTKSTINLGSADTLLYINSLMPNTNYNFQVSGTQSLALSNVVNLTTLDTTSNNFSWQSWTFGENGSSVLNDVAIIDENNIWAVGKIYMNDSLGQPDPHAYNAVHWNGSEWELKRIYYYGNCSAVEYPPLRAIWAFSGNNIVVTNGGSIGWFDGNTVNLDCRVNSLLTGAVTKIWGSSINDLYIVGDNGNIVHYNGSSWTKIESGTDVDIQDIWGITNNNNDNFILCAASSAIGPGEHKILRISNSNSVDTISWISNLRVHSVWMDSKYQLFACGDGMFIKSLNLWKKQEEITPVFKERIRGNSKNDLFLVGSYGLLAHYNGVSWKEYPEASAALVYTSLDIENNLMVTVGYTQRQAVIQFMRRN